MKVEERVGWMGDKKVALKVVLKEQYLVVTMENAKVVPTVGMLVYKKAVLMAFDLVVKLVS
jgi:hypothetical protein